MTQTPKRPKQKEKLTDKEQSERFMETAREVEADEGDKKFLEAVDKLLPRNQTKD
jgi:hypothetical protein